MKTVKAGIIGTGFIGPAHVEAARRVGFVEMIALCEANDDLARTKAAQLGIPKSYGSVDALLKDKEVDAIIAALKELDRFDEKGKLKAGG